MARFYYPWWGEPAPSDCPRCIEDIVGKTPTSIEESDDEIIMLFDDGTACKFYHEQDCCENVSVEDVNGDWEDLIGTPLLAAEERKGETDETGFSSFTWTFYTFRSIEGSVDVRWYGESNGYYSEGVDFVGGFVATYEVASKQWKSFYADKVVEIK